MQKEFLTLDSDSTGEASAVPAISDEAILLSSQERPALFSLLIDRYQAPFQRLAMRVVGERTEAEDVVQDAFIKIYRYAKKFKSGEDRKFSSWAYKIVLNTAITHYHRAKKREWLLPDPAEGGVDLTAGEAHTRFKEALLDRETEAIVKSVLELMPEDMRAVLQAYYLEDKSYKTIAAESRLSIGALKMKLFRARKIFKEHLKSI